MQRDSILALVLPGIERQSTACRVLLATRRIEGRRVSDSGVRSKLSCRRRHDTLCKICTADLCVGKDEQTLGSPVAVDIAQFQHFWQRAGRQCRAPSSAYQLTPFPTLGSRLRESGAARVQRSLIYSVLSPIDGGSVFYWSRLLPRSGASES